MPLTFIMSFPEKVSLQLIEEAQNTINRLSNSINESVISENKVPFKSRIPNFFGKAEGGAARLFGLELYANKNCDSCSICWENCPENNITENKNHKPKFGFSCIMCMRCIYECPQKAISPRISKFIPIKKGYSLKNILKK